MASAEIISSILDHEQEAAEAEQEGVRINWLRTITAFDGPELTVEVMELDEEGRPQPTGRLETLAADTIIMAVGQDADTAFLRQVPGVEFQRDGSVVVSQAMTGCPGVFAGGDMVPDDWPLVRYDPVLRDAGRNPFLLDSHRPRLPLSDYTGRELRYRILARTNPEAAERLSKLAEQQVSQRWATYEEMAARSPEWFPASGDGVPASTENEGSSR